MHYDKVFSFRCDKMSALSDVVRFLICISQFTIAVIKHVRNSTLEKETLVLAHSVRVQVNEQLALLLCVGSYHLTGELMAEEDVHFIPARNQRTRQRY